MAQHETHIFPELKQGLNGLILSNSPTQSLEQILLRTMLRHFEFATENLQHTQSTELIVLSYIVVENFLSFKFSTVFPGLYVPLLHLHPCLPRLLRFPVFGLSS